MKKMVWFIAPGLGLAAMVAPVVVWPPADPYEAPLFPLLRNAQEYLGLGQLVLFFASGLVLGAIDDRHPWLLGLTAVSLLPVVALLEVRVDPSSHTLLPLEILFYGAYGLLIAAGISALRHLAKKAR